MVDADPIHQIISVANSHHLYICMGFKVHAGVWVRVIYQLADPTDVKTNQNSVLYKNIIKIICINALLNLLAETSEKQFVLF